MTSITAQAVDETRKRLCAKCSRLDGCPILGQEQTGERPRQWTHPPKRAIVLRCTDFESAERPKEEAPAEQLEMFGAEPAPYVHVKTGTRWDHYDAQAFGKAKKTPGSAVTTNRSGPQKDEGRAHGPALTTTNTGPHHQTGYPHSKGSDRRCTRGSAASYTIFGDYLPPPTPHPPSCRCSYCTTTRGGKEVAHGDFSLSG